LNVTQHQRKPGFTLIELLTVIGVLGLLMAIILPSLAKARLIAKVVAVNAELYNFGLALESYGMDNKGVYPPTRFDCNADSLAHFWAMPKELVESGYLSGGQSGVVRYADVEDRFNRGFAYKYVAPGPMRSYYGDIMTLRLQIPDGFPYNESETHKAYSDPKTAPVHWMIFSVGPEFTMKTLDETGFPVSKRFWYSSAAKKGVITRVRLKNGTHIGSFEGNP